MTTEAERHELVDSPPPRVPVEWRAAPATPELEVRFADRIIEMLAVPYDETTVVEYPMGSGRLIEEEVAQGAFAGLETRPNRVRANRDHNVERTFGRVVRAVTDAKEGLILSVRAATTPLGDETLELANEGVLDPSVGMAVRPSDQEWSQGRKHRRIVRSYLDHQAMVPNPAYLGAGVLAVRHDQIAPVRLELAPTPNLDSVLAFLEAERARS